MADDEDDHILCPRPPQYPKNEKLSKIHENDQIVVKNMDIMNLHFSFELVVAMV